jgi:hypothetical protein
MYDPIVADDPRHWWNGELRRLQRRDIYLHQRGDQYVLEARSGGKDGTSRWSTPMTEQEALGLADRWQQGQEGWREVVTDATGPDHRTT